jgi:MiaB/RimO family radical SAM methylthiotransferase
MHKKKILKSIGKNVFIISNGCVPNKLASYKISKLVSDGGYRFAPNFEDADIIIFNSCGYCGERINESKEIMEKVIVKKKNDCSVILTGCLDKIDPEIKRDFRCFKVIDILDLPKYFGIESNFDDLNISNCLIDNLETMNKSVYNIVTSKGCLGNCSYCAIKKARGSIKSKPISDIISEFEIGIDHGFRKFILWGDDIGAYGLDIGSSYIKLLKTIINNIPSKIDFHIFLHRLNPQWIIRSMEDVCEILASNKIKMIYSPIQSGSDRILKLMNRNYTLEDITGSFRGIKRALPGLLLKTDIMVGFPTEEDKDIEATIRMIKDIKFDEIVVFKYSGVKNTPAFLMKGQCPEAKKIRRLNKIWDSFPFLRYILEYEKGNYWVTDKKDNLRVFSKYNSYAILPEEKGD